DGVWNTVGATLPFDVMPAFYQTPWFVVLCAAATMIAVWLLYLARIRQLTARIRLRLEERLSEREHIARDLHDTLLQGVQGLLYQFQAAVERLPKTEPVRTVMEDALDRADDLVAQGRERVSGLRGAEAVSGTLEDALVSIATERSAGTNTAFRSTTQGTTRP